MNKQRKSPPSPPHNITPRLLLTWMESASCGYLTVPCQKIAAVEQTGLWVSDLAVGGGRERRVEKLIISLSRNGRGLIAILHQGLLSYSGSLVNPESKWLWGQHTHTYTCMLMSTLCSARPGWPTPPLLHSSTPVLKEASHQGISRRQ